MNQKLFQLFLFSVLIGSGVSADEIRTDVINIKSLYHSGQYKDAAESAKKYLSLSPENKEAKELLAYSLFQVGDYSGVINLYSETEAEYFISPLQLKLRTIAQARVGTYYSAMMTFRILREKEALKDEWKSYYHYLVYKINKRSAFKELKKVNQIVDDISYKIIKGNLHALDGNYPKAIELFELALKKDFLNIEVMSKLGDNYYRNLQYEKAITLYKAIIKLYPEHNEVKMKLAWALEKKGDFLEALRSLEESTDESIVNYRLRLSSRVINVSHSENVRMIASDEVSPIDGQLTLEEKFIPKPLLELAGTNGAPVNAVSVPSPVVVQDAPVSTADKSVLDFYLGPKIKKYNLSGIGFNAQVDYSTGMAAGVKYNFIPGGRNWETSLAIDHSKTTLKNLNGLTPKEATLSETKFEVGAVYNQSAFSVGPLLKYERMTTTQTSPKLIRGDVNLADVGAVVSFSHSITDRFNFKLDFNYFANLIADSKTSSIGSVKDRTSLSSGMTFRYVHDQSLHYFGGVNFLITDTSYNNSASRGTAAANEKERNFTFPLGISYVF